VTMLFKNQPIRRKLAIVTLGATILALALACFGFAIYERGSFRATAVTQLTTLADMLGANAAASVTFNDKKTAEELLGALRAEHHIVAAALYDDKGQLFAEYHRSELTADSKVPGWTGARVHFDLQSVTLRRKVSLKGEEIGSIVILSDLGEFQAKLREFGRISLPVLLVSVLITYVASSRLLESCERVRSWNLADARRTECRPDRTIRCEPFPCSSDEAGHTGSIPSI
jgi:hypothetical protein